MEYTYHVVEVVEDSYQVVEASSYEVGEEEENHIMESSVKIDDQRGRQYHLLPDL